MSDTTTNTLLGNLLTRKQLQQLIGLGECQISNLVRKQKLPQPIKIGGLKNYWVRDEVEAYLQGKLAERNRAIEARRPREAA
jgi:predicted DNA-binding transcriptional regulator AlpA